MKKNKIITFILAAMMMASLAIPASAADAQNQTTVKFTYNASEDIDPENEDHVYKITIPANVDMTGEKGDNGATFTGTGEMKFSGVIGQEDHVDVYVASDNGYHLLGGTNTDVKYKMTTTYGGTTKAIDSRTEFSSNLAADDDIGMATADCQSFQKGDVVTMTFTNDGDTGIYGKCELTDTLTFTYQYNDVDGNEANTFFTAAQ